MGMTMTQKILAKHAGMDEVKKGQLEAIKTHAERKGLSLNAYINELIKRDMQGN